MNNDEMPEQLSIMILFARMVVPHSKNPPDFSEVRKALYCAKILDLFWFEGDLPANEKDQVDYYLNIGWPGPLSVSEDLENILELEEPELRLLCRRIQKPDWLSKGFRKNNLGLDEIPQLWQNI